MPLGLNLAELAPAAPALEALPVLLALAGLIVALGLIKFVVAIVDALLYITHKVVHRVPLIGPSFDRLAKAAAQKITNALGKAEQGLDHYIGWCFHNLSSLVRLLVHEIEELAHYSWVIAKFLAKHPTWNELRHFATALLHPIRTFQHLEHRLVRLYRAKMAALEHTIGAAVLPRIHAGEAALDRVIEWDIPRLRARERAISRRLERLWKWSRAHAKPIATAAFVAAVAVAVRRLGMNWVRCKNWRRIGKHVCGLPTSLIEDVLGLALAFLVVVDPVDVAKAAIKTEDLMHDLVVKIAEAND
jgi:hypothetical protein